MSSETNVESPAPSNVEAVEYTLQGSSFLTLQMVPALAHATPHCAESIDGTFRVLQTRSRPQTIFAIATPAQSRPMPRHHRHYSHLLWIPHPPWMAPLLALLFPNRWSLLPLHL